MKVCDIMSIKRKNNKYKKIEFSKVLTIVDIIVYVILTIVLLIILLIRPELGAFAQNIFAYMTTAYVSLRLGYTAKAGVENYKKIAENYKMIAECTPEVNDTNSDLEEELSTEE